MSSRRVARHGDIVLVDSESVRIVAKEVVCINAIFEVFRKENLGAKSMLYDGDNRPHRRKTSCVSVTAQAVVNHPPAAGNIHHARRLALNRTGGIIDIHQKLFAVNGFIYYIFFDFDFVVERRSAVGHRPSLFKKVENIRHNRTTEHSEIFSEIFFKPFALFFERFFV